MWSVCTPPDRKSRPLLEGHGLHHRLDHPDHGGLIGLHFEKQTSVIAVDGHILQRLGESLRCFLAEVSNGDDCGSCRAILGGGSTYDADSAELRANPARRSTLCLRARRANSLAVCAVTPSVPRRLSSPAASWLSEPPVMTS